MTADEIARLRELCAKATPGPWGYYQIESTTPSRQDNIYQGDPSQAGAHQIGEAFEYADREFIAAARDALPRALDELAELDRLRSSLKRLQKRYSRAESELDAMATARNLAQDLAKQLLDTLANGRF